MARKVARDPEICNLSDTGVRHNLGVGEIISKITDEPTEELNALESG